MNPAIDIFATLVSIEFNIVDFTSKKLKPIKWVNGNKNQPVPEVSQVNTKNLNFFLLKW